MHTFLRNCCLVILLFVITFFALQCGNNAKENNTASVSNPKTYKNLNPDVKYIGMNTCKQCHYDIYKTFIETGMGKSFGIASKTKSSAKFGKQYVVHDKYSNLSCQAFWSGDTMKMMEFRMDGKDTVHKRMETVNYIVGSGQHTNSHIMNVNGHLYQMPMTFYVQKGVWDLPPGFENGHNSHFSRKIGLECMSCHNSFPEFVSGSQNKFKSVPTGISCERCHGPGEEHVKEKSAGIIVDTSKYIDYSIVNPAKLPIGLQLDVCQRCHLQGDAVLKEGKSFYDFRPGMKLSDMEAVFLPKFSNDTEDFIMASHADRLKQSQCFIQSNATSLHTAGTSLKPYKNGLTCVTCHNPHVSVRVTNVDVFNNACKSCHGGKTPVTCTESMTARMKKQDNCVSCHMPKSGSVDIPHVTITDHLIRKPVKKVDVSSVKKFLGLFSINDKHPDSLTIAKAYLNQYEKYGQNEFLLDSAKRYLNDRSPNALLNNFSTIIRWCFIKNDYARIISYASRFSRHKLLQEQLTHTSYANEDAWTCYRIAEAYAYQNNIQEAYSFYKKSTELAPYSIDFLNKLGGNLFSQNKVVEAKKIYTRIINENPKFAPAYCNLGFIYFMQHDYVTAEKYYDQSLYLDPDYEIALMNKVQLYLIQRKENKAKSLLNYIIKRYPENKNAKLLFKQLSTTTHS